MLELRSYFCSDCGKAHQYKDCARDTANRLCCSNCKSTRICLSGMSLMMISATLGLVYILPNIINYKLSGSKEFEFGLIRGDPYVFLPAILLIALVGVLRMYEMKRRQKKPLVRVKRQKTSTKQAVRPVAKYTRHDNGVRTASHINAGEESAQFITRLWDIDDQLSDEEKEAHYGRLERRNEVEAQA